MVKTVWEKDNIIDFPREKTVFAKNNRRKNCSVIVQKKAVAISAAMGKFLHGHVDIYEHDNVFALVNNLGGEYHVTPASPNSNRKLINSRPLARYLKERYGHHASSRLNAWLDGEVVMFCVGDAGENVRFHERFFPVTEVNRLRYDNSIKIIGHRFIISSILSSDLGDSLSAYDCGRIFALINDEKGTLLTAPRNDSGTKMIRSKALTHYVEKRLGKGSMFGIAIPNGIVFSNDERIEQNPIKIQKFKRLEF